MLPARAAEGTLSGQHVRVCGSMLPSLLAPLSGRDTSILGIGVGTLMMVVGSILLWVSVSLPTDAGFEVLGLSMPIIGAMVLVTGVYYYWKTSPPPLDRPRGDPPSTRPP